MSVTIRTHVLSLLLALPAVATAAEEVSLPPTACAEEDLEALADCLAQKAQFIQRFEGGPPAVVFRDVNLQVTHGVPDVDPDYVDGTGNVILGELDSCPTCSPVFGSHNLLVGTVDGFQVQTWGNIVVGDAHEVSGALTLVTGTGHRATGDLSFAIGGEGNHVAGGTAVAGRSQSASGYEACAIGTYDATVSGTRATAVAGFGNNVQQAYASSLGGRLHLVGNAIGNETHSTIIAGNGGSYGGDHVVAVGGLYNQTSASYGVLLAGHYNEARGSYSVAACGERADAMGDYSVVAGGYSNRALGTASTVSGGCSNVAGTDFSSVSGGRSVSTSQTYEWAAGTFASTKP